MTATLLASQAILKVRYPEGKLPTILYENNPGMAIIPTATDFTGELRMVALQTETCQGGSADFSTAVSSLAQGKYSRFQVSRVEDFAIARIRGQALKAAVKDTGALVDLWENEMKGASHLAMRSLAIHQYRNGTGTRGQLAAASGVATVTVTLARSGDVTNFAVGMRVQGMATDGGTLLASGAHQTITGIDRNLGTLTAAVEWSTVITGLSNSHFLLRSGDAAATNFGVITGYDKWIDGTSTPGTLFGLNRNVDPVRLGGRALDAANLSMSDALIEAAALVGIEGGRPSHVFMHPRDAANLKKSLDGKVQYDRVASNVAGISFKMFEIEGDNGTIKCVTDLNCPRNRAFMLQMDTWKMHSLGPAPHMLDYDSNQFLRVSSEDAYEVRVGSYVSMYCTAPAYNIKLTNFGPAGT